VLLAPFNRRFIVASAADRFVDTGRQNSHLLVDPHFAPIPDLIENGGRHVFQFAFELFRSQLASCQLVGELDKLCNDVRRA